jgi:hypothetical protein
MRSVGFGAVYSKGRQVYIYRKNCEILNQAFERKRLRTLKTSFRCVKSTNMSSMKQVVMGLSILNSFCYKRTSADLVFFFNELEQLSLVYELVFCRMKVLRWKDGPRFMSVQHLVRSYLQTLWLQSPEKYEYVQDLIEGNTHAYTILFDDIVSWNSARVRQENLLFSLAKIKKFNRHQFRKLEKLIRILTKYNQKVSKVHLLDFIGKVNRARPRESILSVLHGLFSYYQSLYKQEAFNRIKMATIKVSNDAEGKDKACRILGDIFSKRKYQTLSSIPYRSLFPISELNSYMESASVLGTSLNRLIKKRLADALQQIRHQSDESMSLQLTAERDLISTMETRYQKLLQRHADLLHSVVHRLFVQELCLPFRKLVWFGAQKKNFRDRLLNDLCNLFVKRYLAGFHAIRAEADFVLNQKLMYMREGFSILDMFAKNRINTGTII